MKEYKEGASDCEGDVRYVASERRRIEVMLQADPGVEVESK